MFSFISLFFRNTRVSVNQELSFSAGHGQFESLSPKLLKAIGSCIPKLTYDKHKGQAGRVGVIGGCDDYTGAPYFAAISALRCGADLSFVLTTPSAATAIKSYSPELMVLPYLHGDDAVRNVVATLPRLHSTLIGPGLGREADLMNKVERVIYEIKERGLPLVIDADGLHLITQRPKIIEGYKKAILTPNAAEFERLFYAVMLKAPSEDEPIMDVKQLAKTLQVTVLRKGPVDIISNGSHVLVVGTETSARRCGGQGDILSGFLSLFNFWMHSTNPGAASQKHLKLYGPTMLAAVAACSMVRECNRRAFVKNGRSTLTSDMIGEIGAVFEATFPCDDNTDTVL